LEAAALGAVAAARVAVAARTLLTGPASYAAREDVMDLSMTERVECRVARALLRLVHEAGRRVDKGVEIDFPISRQDIAEMTGTTLFTVSRLLSAWEERGIVKSGRQQIVLTKPHALVVIAEDIPDR
jgi:CRP-like cAMP-binding protein